MATWAPPTLQELKAFHNIDRRAYARLVFDQGLAPARCRQIVAFWNWLERKGCVNFVCNTLELPFKSFLELAQETIMCLDCLKRVSFSIGDPNEILPVMGSVASKKISIGGVYANKENATISMKTFDDSVCKRAFTDIIPKNLVDGLNGGEVDDGPSHSSESEMVFDQLWQDNGTHSPMVVNLNQDQGQAVETQNLDRGSDNRTLFVTFSKGHPITEHELVEFFSRRYGRDCVEKIYIHPLFARVMVSSPQYIEKILGETELAQFNIHGKDIRIRRFVQRRPSFAAGSFLSAANQY